MHNSGIPGSSYILLCQEKEQEEGPGLDLHAHYMAKPDKYTFDFILWSSLLVLLTAVYKIMEMLGFYSMIMSAKIRLLKTE